MGLTQADYLSQLQALLPQGPAWPREASALLTRLLDALSNEFARVDGRAQQLIDEADPRTTYEMLADWERVVGLPDTCVALAGVTFTVDQRRAALLSKLSGIGGQSRAYFIEIAARLGFTITITEFHEWNVGDDVEAALNGTAWNFAWQVNAPLNTVIEWNVESDVEMPFSVWGNEQLQCAMNRNKPAHTVVLFAYT